jgi:hypothetical protein
VLLWSPDTAQRRPDAPMIWVMSPTTGAASKPNCEREFCAILEVPPVAKCDVAQCFYNCEQQCHAPAINVGGSHPNCDTFCAGQQHISRADNSMVGACHVSQCRHNEELTCHASAVCVGLHGDHADCVTFQER